MSHRYTVYNISICKWTFDETIVESFSSFPKKNFFLFFIFSKIFSTFFHFFPKENFFTFFFQNFFYFFLFFSKRKLFFHFFPKFSTFLLFFQIFFSFFHFFPKFSSLLVAKNNSTHTKVVGDITEGFWVQNFECKAKRPRWNGTRVETVASRVAQNAHGEKTRKKTLLPSTRHGSAPVATQRLCFVGIQHMKLDRGRWRSGNWKQILCVRVFTAGFPPQATNWQKQWRQTQNWPQKQLCTVFFTSGGIFRLNRLFPSHRMTVGKIFFAPRK